MAIVAVIAGAYTSTYLSAALNYTKQGYNVHWTVKGERIEETDIYGLCLIDYVGRGAQAQIDGTFKVYSAAVMAAVHIWGGGTVGLVYSAALPIGRLASTIAGALVLTAVPGTSSATAGNIATLTAPGAIISPDSDTQLNLNSVGRDVPIKWDLLIHDDVSHNGSLFSVT